MCIAFANTIDSFIVLQTTSKRHGNVLSDYKSAAKRTPLKTFSKEPYYKHDNLTGNCTTDKDKQKAPEQNGIFIEAAKLIHFNTHQQQKHSH